MATTNHHHHHHDRPNGNYPTDRNRTSSKTGTLYFAYGSNLSPHQMQHRCLDCPSQSAVPVAIARLDAWKWVICERGYANIVPLPLPHRDRSSSGRMATRSSRPAPSPPASEVGGGGGGRHQPDEDGARSSTVDDDCTTVWGVLYNMTPGDVAILDRYEGHDEGRNRWPEENRDPETVARTPFLQGNWDYNKWYIDVTVTKWLQPPSVLGISSSDITTFPPPPPPPKDTNAYTDTTTSLSSSSDTATTTATVKVLTYVDELRTGEGPILKNYVGRMNRAIEESVALGLPRRWVDRVMRRWVMPGIFPKHGYVGTKEGYVPAQEMVEETESSSGGEVVRMGMGGGSGSV